MQTYFSGKNLLSHIEMEETEKYVTDREKEERTFLNT